MGEDCDSESVTDDAIFIKESWSSDLDADLGEVGESTLRELVKDLRELRRDGGTRRDGVGGEPNTQKPVIISVLSLCLYPVQNSIYRFTAKCELLSTYRRSASNSFPPNAVQPAPGLAGRQLPGDLHWSSCLSRVLINV